MKLRKLFATAAMALLVGATASAQTTDEARIYINPGHGSWGPNNRHMATIGHSPISTADPDTTDFFESNTNLRKGLALLERLHEYGVPFDKTKNQTNDNPNRVGAALDLTQNLVMSHVKVGPYPYETVDGVSPDNNNDFNRNLSVISAEVEANDFDLFISIHSNANVDGDGINYLYFIYRTNYGADATKCVDVAEKCWDHRILDRHTQWSHYDNLVGNGSVKIATGNYLVLCHSVPGYLVEGYFHTYQPSRHRYMNFDVCRLEGIDYARGIADYFGWTKENTGDIYGVVRDKYEKFTHSLYTPKAGTLDVYKPLNDVLVTLKKGEETLAVDTTDINYNGVFIFRDLEPGDYTVEFSHPDYKPIDEPLTVTVKAAVTSYPTAFLENVNYVPPTIEYVNYPDSTAGKTGYAVFPNYNVTSKETSLLADVLADKTVRRQIVRDGKLYVLALDAENEPYIYLADLAGGTVTELDKAAVVMGANGRLKISDIALTADHVLVASGLSRNQIADAYVVDADVPETANEVRGTTNFYKWTKNEKTGLPETCELWFGSQYCCNWYRGFLGQTIAFDGTIENGTLSVSCPSGWTDTSTTMRIAQFEVSDGDMLGAMRLKASTMGTNVLGEGFQLMISPRGEKQYVFDGSSMNPTEWLTTSDNNEVTVLGTNTALNVKSVGANYFKYAEKDLMVAPAINEEGKVEGIKLFDITNGLDNATEIVLNGGTIEPVECKYASAHGELELELSTEDRTIGAEMVLYLVIDGKAVKFTEKGATTVTPKSGNANPFAYALKSEVADEALKVSYSLNTAAQSVTIKVKNASDEEVATATGAVEAGAHTAEISLANLADGDYTWEIEVAGESNTTVKEFAALRYYHPRGVDVDNNMESENFGTIYVTEGMTTTSSTYFPTNNGGVGLYIFNPDMTSVKNEVTGKYAFMGDLTYTFISYGADLARVRVSEDGRIFVTRCNNAGDYILYAPSQADLVKNDKWTSLLSGGTLNDDYTYSVNDSFLASANIGFDVKGSGEDLKMMTVAADKGVFSFNASGSRVDEYELGEATVLPTPTKVEALSGYTIAPQVTNVEYDDQGGVWYCQYRGTPSDAEPALIYVDANGEQKLFEGAGGTARGGGGIRISPDSKKIAIASSKTQFTIYNLYYSEDGTPIIQPETVVTHGIGTNVYDFGWDLAGNLYIVGNSGEYLKGFALPRTDAFTTKAASKYAFKIGESSVINEIEADENAPVEYYNLQGVKVTNPENGVFIKKQGNKATKVVL